MKSTDDLLELIRILDKQIEASDTPAFGESLNRIKKVAESVGKAASGSWLGYHANVYYAGLQAPPPGARFSQQEGLKNTFGDWGSRGDWREYDPDTVVDHIKAEAKTGDTDTAYKIAKDARVTFADVKSSALTCFAHELSQKKDRFVSKKNDELEELEPLTPGGVVALYQPTRQIMTSDYTAIGQGVKVPPHWQAYSQAAAAETSITACRKARKIINEVASYLARNAERAETKRRVGTNVFIGHGRSSLWRELKDFIQDRICLPCDEFNRVPVAGITNITRLSEMLDAAAFAFLIMTGEDEHADGSLQARMNVIHEVGLFQGRLGFTKAIVLLEDGCQEFSNIQGLGQIRFQKGKISTAFEEIRMVLEREMG